MVINDQKEKKRKKALKHIFLGSTNPSLQIHRSIKAKASTQ